jgi:plastocyanin
MSTASPTVHIVAAGQGTFMYSPNKINANVGDIVSFQFYPTNHSVVQGVYCGDTEGSCNPCVPIDLIDNNVKGFASQNYLTEQNASPENLNVCTPEMSLDDLLIRHSFKPTISP